MASVPLAAKLTSRLPRMYGLGALPQALSKRYRRSGEVREVEVRGVRLRVRPDNEIESFLLFGPQFYDRHELDFLGSRLRPGDRFVDLGGYIGLYALFAARRVGPRGRVVCVEMDPRNAARIEEHVAMNAASNVAVERCAVGADDGEVDVFLRESETNYNSLLSREGTPVRTRIRTLASLLAQHALDGFDGGKLDIEGYEAPVLRRYFADTPRERDPRFLVVERSGDCLEAGAEDPHPLLRERGYRHVGHRSWNHFYEKP